ncbi:unnamed protein product [Lactuca virosa]|uniref:Uncharacterized protein n=1 Tax=Lactuca virosa TaxID=75947 RepID=A0AAU9NVZ6_9ASTR|nr:unnamed protein product [Lactuca virosa]
MKLSTSLMCIYLKQTPLKRNDFASITKTLYEVCALVYKERMISTQKASKTNQTKLLLFVKRITGAVCKDRHFKQFGVGGVCDWVARIGSQLVPFLDRPIRNGKRRGGSDPSNYVLQH